MAKTKKREPYPADELRALEASLSQGTLARAYVFRGEERYFRERAAAAVVRAADAAELEICKHDAVDPDFDLARLLDDLVAGSLFAAARCVVIQRADSLLKKGARKFAPGLIAAIQARLASDDTGCLVVTADALRVDSVIVKAIIAVDGGNIACRRLWDSPPPWAPDPRRVELVLWILARAKELGVALQTDEAVYVAAATGNDLYALEAQLEGLRSRGDAGIVELVGWQAGGSPYTVAEALVSGDTKRAVAGIEALFQSGFQGRGGVRTADSAAILAMLSAALTSKLREAAAGARALESGADMEAAMAIAGVRGPRARGEFKDRVSLRPSVQWLGLADEVAEIERRSRTGAKVDAADFAKLALRWSRTGRGR